MSRGYSQSVTNRPTLRVKFPSCARVPVVEDEVYTRALGEPPDREWSEPGVAEEGWFRPADAAYITEHIVDAVPSERVMGEQP